MTGTNSFATGANQAATGRDNSLPAILPRLRAAATPWLVLLCLLLAFPLHARDTSQPGQTNSGTESGAPVLEVFIREDCPHCAAAKEYLSELQKQQPALRMVFRPVDREAAATEDLLRHSQNAGVWPPGVPTFVFNGQVLVGFLDAERSGPEILALIESQAGMELSVETGPFGTVSVERLGLPVFTLALGLLDGFNPCAMWVLLFLLSLLVHLHDRRRMALIAGTFVLISGLVYYAFMAAWLNVFLLVGMSVAVRLALGGTALLIGVINVKDFLAPGRSVSLSIPASAKPGLFIRMRTILRTESLLPSLVGVAALAVVVNFIELLCTAGLPAIYTAVLAQQGLSAPAHYAYLGLYIVGYITDDALMVTLAVAALSSRKLSRSAGRWLKLLSGVVMLALGAILVLHPEWLL
jgi:glutaredoxin